MKWLWNRIAIDLGTAATRVVAENRGLVVDEPSVVAVSAENPDAERVLCVGSDAKHMLGKTPANIRTIRPLRNGAIVNINAAGAMLKQFIRRASNGHRLPRTEAIVAVPAGITPIEMHAVRESLVSAGARRVLPVESPLAAAVGAGLPVTEPTCSMVVDIGEGTTEVAVISLAGLVTMRTIKVAGGQMDGAIQQYIRQRYSLLIGEHMAEQIKIQIGCASLDPVPTAAFDLKGRDLATGIPKVLRIDAAEIHAAIGDPLNAVIKTIQRALEDIPPELSADVLERGILLTGGGALLQNMQQRLHDDMNLPVTIPENPLTTVALGAAKLLDNRNGLQQFIRRQ
jgi:rod shape-determining protein MreB